MKDRNLKGQFEKGMMPWNAGIKSLPKTCSIEGCGKHAFARGWCIMHYKRWKSNGDPLVRRTIPRIGACKIDDCDKKIVCSELCEKHYQSFRKYGDAIEVTRLKMLKRSKPIQQILNSKNRLIPLTQGKYAIVDRQDFEYLSQFQWYTVRSHDNGQPISYAARSVNVNGKKVRSWMHVELMNTPPKLHTDHKNHNGLDNRRKNLRIVTPSINILNSRLRSDNTSGYKGINKTKFGTWTVTIGINKKKIYLGCFKVLEEAVKARTKAEKEAFANA